MSKVVTFVLMSFLTYPLNTLSFESGHVGNFFGAYIGGYGDWGAFVIKSRDDLSDTSCRLVHKQKDGIILAEFQYGEENSFVELLKKENNVLFNDPNFLKTKKLLHEMCVLKNPSYAVQEAAPDLVLCSRDVLSAKLVLWNIPAVTKEGYFMVNNKLVDGIVFTTGNGYRPDYYSTTSGTGGGVRYLDAYLSNDEQFYTQILIDYGKGLWNIHAAQCNSLLDLSACKNNYDKHGYNNDLNKQIVDAADGLWSRQFCDAH